MEDIFAPLGMQDSYFYLPVAKAKRLVTLYGDFKGQGLVVLEASDTGLIKENPRYPVDGAHSYFPGGVGLSSTTQDSARFCQMLLNDGAFEGTRLLSRKSVELMRSPKADINKDVRFQPVNATHLANRSAGVSKFNVFLGRSFSRRATAFNLFWWTFERFIPFGKYCLRRPLVFSFDPRCQGLWGSQKYTWILVSRLKRL